MAKKRRGRPKVRAKDRLQVVSIRLPTKLVVKIKAYAKKERRTMAVTIRILLEDALK